MCTNDIVITDLEEPCLTLALHNCLNNSGNNAKEAKTEIKQVEDLSDDDGINLQSGFNNCLADLTTVICKRDHSKLKNLKTFSMDDLPKSYQKEEMISLIHAAADLAVLIQLPFTNTGFSCQGTGTVDNVFIFRENTSCLCRHCESSEHPSQSWGKVLIATSTKLLTACSVVSEIKCTVFFNDEEAKDVKILYGDNYVSNKQGVCKFFAYTCDMKLLEKLEACVDDLSDKWVNAYYKFYKTVKCQKEKLLIMICHPHAAKKHILLGQWCSLKPQLQFIAESCPGSEGSLLIIPDFDDDDDDDSDDDDDDDGSDDDEDSDDD